MFANRSSMFMIILCWMIVGECPDVVWCQMPCRGMWRLSSIRGLWAVSLPRGVTHTGGATLDHTLVVQRAQGEGWCGFHSRVASRPWGAAKCSSKCTNNERKGKKETGISVWLWNSWFCALRPNPSAWIEVIFAGEVLYELNKITLLTTKS